ncbi:transcriptional regulator [Vibrio azureus]|uniref:Putative transcriptional regulator n=1 Tax=Vibrio azureus NBRC 104587 TaxID=1219077 RepID=U3A9Q6_9VIBR|nr:phage repressor protein CI [Vibrio azureus]AUI87680.1 transcriptional regulator [Vibrio azureus]GAD76671.1 putative transcriptional regulator [Vibrio azureus NBRC 104587]
MQTNQLKIEVPNYISGKDFLKKLMKVTDTEQQQELAAIFGVPKSTLATWRQRDLTPHEIAVRAHLKLGVSLNWLLLDEGEPFINSNVNKHTTKFEKEISIFDIDCFSIEDGKLKNRSTISFDKAVLNELGAVNVMAIKDGQNTFIVNKESRQAVSGTYLVDMDGLLSLNEIQRLPGKKLAISFNGSTLTVDENEVIVVGRVALAMEKK